MTTIVERIKELCSYLKITENRFAGEIDVNSQTLNNYTSGKRKIGFEVVDKILIRYPQLSAEWLMRGSGDMFCHGDSNTEIQQTNVRGDNNAVVNSGAGGSAIMISFGLFCHTNRLLWYRMNQNEPKQTKIGGVILGLPLF